jgi:hypothetical protein
LQLKQRVKMIGITFENMAEKLIEVVPELRCQYESELEWWGDEQPGAHIIFGDVLNPYLICLLESGNQEAILARIFAFLEELASHEDTRVQEVVAVTVCERLGDDSKVIEKARRYMGNKTLSLSNEIEAFWGRDVA